MNHITILLISSPSEDLDVELLGGESRGSGGATYALDPGFRAADVDVARRDVRRPVQHRGDVVDALGSCAEPGVACPAVAGQVHDPQPALAAEHFELRGEQRLLGETV